MSNELLGKFFDVKRMWPGDPGDHKPIPPYAGYHILYENLGYHSGECHRLVSDPNHPHGISACWFDLYIPALWFVGGVVLSYLLLRFFVHDPH